ncbi:MAG: pantoate--beta-alanine ligase [Acidobacteriota bacterium]
MKIISTVREMQAACRSLRKTGSLGLAPTMGALHDGHLSLVRRAKAENDAVAVSIFVNPAQFAPGEDYDTYPRRLAEDCAKLEAAGVDLLFAPSVEQMYPSGAASFVEVAGLGDRLDGASRPGHFRGVATVVAKLFHIVDPDRAYFGQKDAAQVAVLRAMVRGLHFPLQLVVCPIVREPSGLAMSSRNLKLSAAEKDRALALSRALQAAARLLGNGETRAAALRAAMLSHLSGQDGVRLDYAEVVHPETLLPVADTRQGALLAVAAWVGQTRLIDNLLVETSSVEHLRTASMPEQIEEMHV